MNSTAPDASNAHMSTRGRSVRRRLSQLMVFLLLGAVVTVAVAWALSAGLDVSTGKVRSASSAQGEEQWTVTRWDRPGAALILSVRETGRSWSASQATGAPDTSGSGDIPTAWASATPDGQPEWLVLTFAEAVNVRAIQVHETCSPGAVVRITAFTPDGKEVEGWRDPAGAPRPDAAGQSRRVLDAPVSLGFPVNRVKVYIDSPAVPGWNEIDAVGLIDSSGQAHWAVGATASSVYGSYAPVSTPGGAEALVPAFTGLRDPSPANAAPSVPVAAAAAAMLSRPSGSGSTMIYTYTGRAATRVSSRAADLRGWPMLALWAEVPVPAGSATPGPTTVPFRPIWPGFLVNTLVYAVALMPVWWALTVPRRFVREVGRLRRGCCIACGYDLGYDFARGCPECGWRRAPDRPGGWQPAPCEDEHATVG